MLWTVFILLIVIGALSGYKTWTNTFAIGIDILGAEIGTNSKLPITISSRSGLAARRGKNRGWAKFINWLMRSPTHCEDAITYDILRSITALDVLFDGNAPACFLELKKEAHLTGQIK